MSERSEESPKAAKAPKLTVETAPVDFEEDVFSDGADGSPEGSGRPALDADDLADAVGFIKGVGATAWKYAVGHPFTVAYGFTGLVLAILILLIGLWDTIVIAVFVVVGAMIGQIRDGDNGIVHFFSRLFSGRH